MAEVHSDAGAKALVAHGLVPDFALDSVAAFAAPATPRRSPALSPRVPGAPMRDGCPLAPRLPLPSCPLGLFDLSAAEGPLFPPFAGFAEDFDDVLGALGIPPPASPFELLEQFSSSNNGQL